MILNFVLKLNWIYCKFIDDYLFLFNDGYLNVELFNAIKAPFLIKFFSYLIHYSDFVYDKYKNSNINYKNNDKLLILKILYTITIMIHETKF